MATWQTQIEGGGVTTLLTFLNKNLDGKHMKELSELSALALTPADLRKCANWLRELRETKDPTTPSLRHFLAGTRVHPRVTTPEEPPSKARVKYLEKRREKLMRLDEEMRYGHLVKNVKTQTASKELQKSLTSVKQHLSIGANMVVSRIVAFIVVYIASRPLTDNETTRIIMGLGGAVFMMVVEMVLFIARAAKYDALEQRQKRERESVFEQH